MKKIIFVISSIIILCVYHTGCKKAANTTGNSNTNPIVPNTPANPTTSGVPVNPATVTTPGTAFIESAYDASNKGAYWGQQFTISKSTSFVFRLAVQYKAQAAIITPDQLNNFQTNKAFTGYAIFDNQFGTKFITLAAGTNYVAIRNTANGPNQWRVELDYAVSLPASDKAVFYDNYFNSAKDLTVGTPFWQPFTIQSGFRYFLDGCNVGLEVYIVPEDQLLAFQGSGSFKYYTDYHTGSGADPGRAEIKLPVGNYYLVASSRSGRYYVYNGTMAS